MANVPPKKKKSSMTFSKPTKCIRKIGLDDKEMSEEGLKGDDSKDSRLS